jgi:hypothetical protein
VSVVQKWLTGLISLGALYLVVANPQGVASALGGAQKFISGTEATAIGK